jgi:hypothetical protein
MNHPYHNPEQLFYQQVSHLLDCELIYQPWPFSKKTRWNNRLPGNGRFPGRGLVRRFNSRMIQVHLTNPPLVGWYHQEHQALQAIEMATFNKDA